ncbi:MAG: hypothetical protein QXV93_07030 [Zestosphaera sp.]
MRIKYVDISNKTPLSALNQLVEKARAYDYSTIVLHGLTTVETLGDVRLVPRTTIDYKSNIQAVKSKSLKVFSAKTPEELKLSNQVLSVLNAVEVGGKLLSDSRSRKSYVKLVNVGKPVILNASEIIDLMLSGRDLSGLQTLLSLYEKSQITIALGSGARSLSEVHHPTTYYALLLELGLSEVKALSALAANPASILRGAGF